MVLLHLSSFWVGGWGAQIATVSQLCSIFNPSLSNIYWLTKGGGTVLQQQQTDSTVVTTFGALISLK